MLSSLFKSQPVIQDAQEIILTIEVHKKTRWESWEPKESKFDVKLLPESRIIDRNDLLQIFHSVILSLAEKLCVNELWPSKDGKVLTIEVCPNDDSTFGSYPVHVSPNQKQKIYDRNYALEVFYIVSIELGGRMIPLLRKEPRQKGGEVC